MESEGKPAGKSSIQLILDDCVIFENWTGTSGYSGKSFNLYNKRLGKWQQFWVDNAGVVIQFLGEFKDGQMRLEGESLTPEGDKVKERMTFFPLSADRVRQLWEQSRDNGKSWTVAFDGIYIRRK